MKRSEFLKRLGLGIVAIPLIPKVAAEVADMIKDEAVTKVPLPDDYVETDELYRRYGDKDINEVMEIYRDTGDLIYTLPRKIGVHIVDGKYPLRINDEIEVTEKRFVVTYVDKGLARCVSTDMWHDVIYIDMKDFDQFYFFGSLDTISEL